MANNYPWVGKAEKITDYDLPRIGHKIGVGEDEIHALLDVESRGTGFDKNGVIKLFEEHVFYRNLPKGKKRQQAVDMGIAYPKWRRNYKNNHETFLKAYKFHPTAALKACSWGLGQTLGENYVACGYASPQKMVQNYAASEANQLEGMINFIIHNNLDDELREHDWAGFARGYNGKYYYKHNYHGRLKKRYEWWARKPDTPWTPASALKEEQYNEGVENHPKPIIVDKRDAPDAPGTITVIPPKGGPGPVAGGIAGAIVVAVVSWWNELTTWIGGLF